MNEEMKKIFGKFLLSTVLIVCVSAFLAGSTTVKERGEYNLYLTKYAVMSFSGTSEKLSAKLKEDEILLNLPLEKMGSDFRKYIWLTPLSPFYYLAESTRKLLQ